tara:strand:- start:2 stop:403 length:402 start_codon:yes stop_codon:yes gene_type:complete
MNKTDKYSTVEEWVGRGPSWSEYSEYHKAQFRATAAKVWLDIQNTWQEEPWPPTTRKELEKKIPLALIGEIYTMTSHNGRHQSTTPSCEKGLGMELIFKNGKTKRYPWASRFKKNDKYKFDDDDLFFDVNSVE